MMRSVRDWIGSAIIGMTLGIAFASALGARQLQNAPAIDGARAKEAYLDLTGKEADERRDAALHFPGSLWSQQDDFGANEAGFVRRVASNRHVSIGSVLLALDEGMRERWPIRPGATVITKIVPCRPRLSYH
jgi:hypothetical protein